MRSRTRSIALLIGVLATLAGCQSNAPSNAPAHTAGAVSSARPAGPTGGQDGLPPLGDVPFYRADALRTAMQPGPAPAAKPQIAWTYEAASPLTLFPTLVGGSLIVGTSDGELLALEARTGSVRWTASGFGTLDRSAGSADGIVTVADGVAVHALEAATGKPLWETAVETKDSRQEIADGVVYVGTTDGGVKGFDLHTGAERFAWQGAHGLAVRVDIVADGTLYASVANGNLIAISTADGSERWRYSSRASRMGISKVGDTLYVSNAQPEGGQPVGAVAAVDIGTGKARWQFAPPSGRQANAGAVRDGVVYVGTAEDGLYALRDEGSSFTELWHVDSPALFWPVNLVGDVLYGLTGGGAVLASSIHDGSTVWLTDGPGGGDGPVVSGGMVFVSDQGGGTTVRAYADPTLIAMLPRPSSAPAATSEATPAPANPFTIVRATPLEDLGVTTGDRSDGPQGTNMAVGPDGFLYVIDNADVLTVIDPTTEMAILHSGREGAADGEFGGICGIAVAPDGRIYVADLDNHRVQILGKDGSYVGQLGSFGSEDGQFVSPARVRVDAADNVYVLDWDSRTLSRFDSKGSFVWRVGGANASDPALRDANYDFAVMKSGQLLVTTDGGGSPILVNADDGSVAGRWAANIGASGEPTVDGSGNVVMIQYVPAAMKLFDPTGKLLGVLDYEDGVPDPYLLYPAPVFAPDGFAYSFDAKAGLLQVKVATPAGG
jgi:outer membrane protein assembly factor BamB